MKAKAKANGKMVNFSKAPPLHRPCYVIVTLFQQLISA